MDNTEKKPIVRQRKSTLTQQQKNKKRQRATPQQLRVLRSEFMINATPNAKTREEIGRRIDMTERSVQIWFQNKRAKAKQFAKKGGSCDSDSNINSQYGCSNTDTPGMSPMGSPPPCMQTTTPNFVTTNGNEFNSAPRDTSQTIAEIVLPCISLCIGTWRRVVSNISGACNLKVGLLISEKVMAYTMYANFTGFLMKYPLSDLKSIKLVSTDPTSQTLEMNIEISKPPIFSIQNSKTMGKWVACDDFSESTQASVNLLHKITGPTHQIRAQLAQISQIFPLNITGLDEKDTSLLNVSDYMDIAAEFSCQAGDINGLEQSPETNIDLETTEEYLFGTQESKTVFSADLPTGASFTSLLFNESSQDWNNTATHRDPPPLEVPDVKDSAPSYMMRSFEDSNNSSDIFLENEFLDLPNSPFRHGSSTSNTSNAGSDTEVLLEVTDSNSSFDSSNTSSENDSLLLVSPANFGEVAPVSSNSTTDTIYDFNDMSIEPSKFDSDENEEKGANDSFGDDSSLLSLIPV